MNTQTQRPPTIDPKAAARWLRRDRKVSPWLHEEIARRMQERLGWIRQQPQSWLDWETRLGGLASHKALQNCYPKAKGHLGGHDVAKDLEALAPRRAWWQPTSWLLSKKPSPQPEQGVDLVWANMVLHMNADPQDLIEQWQKALAVDGMLMFSCLGPDTLREIRDLYARLAWPAPAHEFTDMHDWGDMLVQAGFTDPVLDVERIELTFPTAERLLLELRGLGRNLHLQRFGGLRGRAWHDRLCKELLALPRSEVDGSIRLTFEVIYGHAIKAAPRIQMQPQTTLSLEAMRQALRRDRSGQAD